MVPTVGIHGLQRWVGLEKVVVVQFLYVKQQTLGDDGIEQADDAIANIDLVSAVMKRGLELSKVLHH